MESFPPGGLKISWRAPVGRGWSSPIVAQLRVYVTDVELDGQTARERVLCFDEVTGKLLWSHLYSVNYPDWAFDPAAGGPRATPIFREGRLFTLGADDATAFRVAGIFQTPLPRVATEDRRPSRP